MAYYLGIDLGTTYTAAAVWRDGRLEVCSLGVRALVVPSVVFLREDGEFLVGEAAERRAGAEPQRAAREFKRRVGDTTPIILGATPCSTDALMAKVLRWVVDRVAELEGDRPEGVAVSHPANWGDFKKDVLGQAIALAGLTGAATLSEPEAAAVHYSSLERVAPGSTVAIYDLGGGTFDAAVLRKLPDGWELLGEPHGVERLGGVDFDEAVFHHVRRFVGSAFDTLDPDDTETLAALARLRHECVTAKEALSADTEVTIGVWLPNGHHDVRLTRTEFEDFIRPRLAESLTALRQAVRSAALDPAAISTVLLVGGSSRIPLVAQVVGAELGRPVAIDAHPKHGVALGAARFAAERAGGRAVATAPVAPPPTAPGSAPPEPAPSPSTPGSAPPEPASSPTARRGRPPQPAVPAGAGPAPASPLEPAVTQVHAETLAHGAPTEAAEAVRPGPPTQPTPRAGPGGPPTPPPLRRPGRRGDRRLVPALGIAAAAVAVLAGALWILADVTKGERPTFGGGADEVATLTGHDGWLFGLAYSPDGELLASAGADGTARLWNTDRDEQVATLDHGALLLGVSFSPDGDLVATGGDDGDARLWDTESHESVATLDHGARVGGPVFSPDGELLATPCADNIVRLWDTDSFDEVAQLRGHTDGTTSVAFSPDGELLATASQDGTIRLWDPESHQDIATLEGHDEEVTTVAFSPDGEILASASLDATVRLWNVESREEIALLEGHTDGVFPIAFSPDGEFLASPSVDNTVRLWNVTTLVEIAVLQHEDEVRAVAFSPDGHRLASASLDGRITLWEP